MHCVNVSEELDKLHAEKARLMLATTATINISQQLISKASKLSKEIKKITGEQRD